MIIDNIKNRFQQSGFSDIGLLINAQADPIGQEGFIWSRTIILLT